jgi:3-deoxy-D-manno-octulosonate 8-phosphate phosphatase (KDO 8-P phosphatase)
MMMEPTSPLPTAQPKPLLSKDALEKAGSIRFILLDVDGVLTDGRMYLGDGVEMKAYNAKDGLGITLLRSSGLKVGIITGRSSASVERRAKELHLDFLMQGRPDKSLAFQELCKSHELEPSEVAYMGDDWIDLELLQSVGLAASPLDACAEVLEISDFISTKPGGHGAVREFAEFILKTQGHFNERLIEFKTGRGQAASTQIASAQKGAGQ